ncbi:MAG: hypothetical protein AAB617_01750 [Patescibacteria group bacterium]
MKLRIIDCPCGVTRPHKRFSTRNGSHRTRGFFSIAAGEAQLKALKKAGDITVEEAKDARKELANCGLPAEPPDSSEDQLVLAAASLISTVSNNEKRDASVAEMLLQSTISEKSAARLRELLADEEETLNAADMEDLKIILAAVDLKAREWYLKDGEKRIDITPVEAESLREYLKDVPVTEGPGLELALRAGDRMQSREISRGISKSGEEFGMDVEVFRL